MHYSIRIEPQKRTLAVSDSAFEPHSSSTFNGFSDSRFYYHNLHYQEALTTLRYGIQTRKGLILFTGDAGTGKTILLEKLTAELDANVTCISISDPHLNLSDILRLILDRQQIEAAADSELELLQRCKRSLRSQLANNRIFCLILDNAQNLPDATLDRLIGTFFDADAQATGERLLPVLLSGRPELRERLLGSRRSALKQCAEILCELHPLDDKELGQYLDHRLRQSDVCGDLFQSDALRRIAAHAKGIPRLANAICDRAMHVAGTSARSKISVDMIDDAARDLQLTRPPPSRGIAGSSSFERPNQIEEPFDFQLTDGDTTQVVGQTFLNYANGERRRWLLPVQRDRSLVRVFVLLMVIGGVVVWLKRGSGQYLLTGLAEVPQAPAGSTQKLSPADSPTRVAPPAEDQQSPVIPPIPPSVDNPPRQPSDAAQGNLAPPESEKLIDSPAATAAENSSKKTQTAPTATRPRPTRKSPQPLPAENSGTRRKLLEAEIYQAIENRAILGVEVSVVDGTAYLEGRVATQRQKQAAERAARSVSGIERVRNRIVVS